jgi:hypothetical protein
LTLKKEKAAQELVSYNIGPLYGTMLPKAFHILQESPPALITMLTDDNIRQKLSLDYMKMIQQTKDDLTNILITAAQINKNNCEKKFHDDLANIWNNQRQLSTHERLSPGMVTLIERRQTNIIQCIKVIYACKMDFFLALP